MAEKPAAPASERAPAAALETVETVDVKAVNTRDVRALYKKREKIFPRRARGSFRNLKWAVMAVTLAIYYLAPWLRWDRGPLAPDQAILIDIPARRFYFFFIEIWPQEVYYITGILVIAAMALFLFTSLAGRVWCGYACPQTVWVDLFLAIERLIEGDRTARIRLERAAWSLSKIAKRLVKHVIWLIIAALTGGAWVFYFADAPTLFVDLLTLRAPEIGYITVGVLTATTYLLGGLAREQVCTFMCPWPRIQAAMIDEESLIISYHPGRGEPRGPSGRGGKRDGLGDCVACNQCVVVCPMGIDIRDGMQLECISCALCIDACDGVMDRFDKPRGLISYDTLANIEGGESTGRARIRWLRPRTVIYGVIIAIVGSIMLAALMTRPALDLNVLRDRNPLFVTLSDGSVRNGYTLKILNKLHAVRDYRLSVEGLPGARIKVIGRDDGDAVFTVRPDRLASFRVFISTDRANLKGEVTDMRLVLTDRQDGARADYETNFRGPRR
ncbi:MAG: cytochrome c oxidase accessory protein CcoG [Alphaproteobacteria bacterium]|jgi:cytochrome c oxidase accessory protein FixG|nr:cytochrome c oxidase accessory protein CcoG [Alphaproteobacteria bacterium]MDP6563247.1 cytochrome c oxidase accessory protein CcoG [Alphaproteobacteria bacterium]MDP6814114.1 cytochrome c oxidase accessory protein CcoG [Alphaproteobacteria bacterium]